MARNMYGATSADFTLTSGGRVVPGATLTIWSARTGGTQITDLLDKDSVATTTVTSDADGSIVYYGPNNDKTVHWADSGVGSRIAIRPVDITGDPPVLSIGTVGTGAAAANLTGTSEAPVLNLTLPSAGTNGVNTAAIQNDAVTADKIAANAVGSSELADNAVDTAAIQDGAVTAAKLARQPGNLLTDDQANVVGGGWYGINATFDTTTDSGDTVGRYTLTATGASDFANLLASAAFAVGETRTTLVDVKSSRSQVIRLSSNGHDAGWSGVDVLPLRSVTVAANTWTTIAVTGAPAASKAYVGLVLRAAAGQSGDVILVRRASLHRGAAGTFSLPGTPIVGQSHIATNGAVHLSGTGTPEGVITADPGSTWLQTDSTTDVKGWIRWVKATGTGNTGWVAGPEADTGWRDVTAGLINSWGAEGSVLIRRTGSRVVARFIDLRGASSFSQCYSLPSGFAADGTFSGLARESYLTGKGVLINMSTSFLLTTQGLIVDGTAWSSGHGIAGSLAWNADPTTWPTSLPGSPA